MFMGMAAVSFGKGYTGFKIQGIWTIFSTWSVHQVEGGRTGTLENEENWEECKRCGSIKQAFIKRQKNVDRQATVLSEISQPVSRTGVAVSAVVSLCPKSGPKLIDRSGLLKSIMSIYLFIFSSSLSVIFSMLLSINQIYRISLHHFRGWLSFSSGNQ